MTTGTRCTRVAALVAALLATACGEGLDAEQAQAEVDMLETRADAVISNATKGATIRAVEGVNLRSGASTSYSVILTVPAGHTATILNPTPSNGFYYINYQGTRGWSHGDYWNVVAGLVVNGTTLNSTEESRLRWIASNTIPRLQGANRDERLTKGSRVAWWTLKEGVLESYVTNPHSYSNCGGTYIGPLSSCSASAWQAGISGAQVWNYTLAQLEQTALALYPGWTVQNVLGNAANIAGYATGSTTYNGIVNSTGDLRRSWLVRHHAVGFTRNEATVTWECITNSQYWCYSAGWYPSSAYAPNKDAAMRSIREIKAIFDGLSP